MSKAQLTVLISPHINWLTLRSIPHTGPGQHPDPIVCPLGQVIQNILPGGSILNGDNSSFTVRTFFWYVEYLVVYDHTVLLVLRGWSPDHAQGGGGLRVCADVVRWCSRNWFEKKIKQNLLCV